jgi:hypothetical protein
MEREKLKIKHFLWVRRGGIGRYCGQSKGETTNKLEEVNCEKCLNRVKSNLQKAVESQDWDFEDWVTGLNKIKSTQTADCYD